MPRSVRIAVGVGTLVFGAVFVVTVRTAASPPAVALSPMTGQADRTVQSRSRLGDGQAIFRFHTFGDEQLWTDQLQMHRVIETGVDPVTALAVGLKVDAEAIPPEVQRAIGAGRVDLTNPATTVALIALNAVVGVVGKVEKINGRDRLTEVGITCALCHSTVDDSFMPGIGRRLDGWPNLDLDPGRIIALSPTIPAAAKQVYNSWGPGKYDPRFNIDGLNTPLVIPPAYGLANVEKETFTGEGPISYWNNYVAVTQMGGKGSFSEPLLGINIIQTPDQVQPRLPALRDYQLSLLKPSPPLNSFDQAAATRGKGVFDGAGRCATCHIPPLYTDVNLGILHDPAETGMNAAYAERTTTRQYRTTPLRALWQHPPYFHDGSAVTLQNLVEHYNAFLRLGLTDDQMRDLVEFLKSI
jgi:mono/diheme cytochrome c family protein